MHNEPFFSEAKQMMQNKQFFEAYHQLAQLSSLHPQNSELWSLMGYSLAQLGLYLSASKRFKRALQIFPDSAEAQKNLQHSLSHAQNFSKQVSIPRHPACVSAIIVTYNKWSMTEQCLKYLVEKTPELQEIIVVDNHSSDETPEKLKAWQAKDPDRYKIILNQKNLGYAAACNQGLAMAQSEYLMIMNNDILVTYGWLARMLNDMEREKVYFTGPSASNGYGQQTIQEIPRDFIWKNDLLEEYAQQRALKYKHQGLKTHRLVGFCILFHRKVCDIIGGLDTRFGIGTFEDDDFCYRAIMAGFQPWWSQSSFVHHLGGVSFQNAQLDVKQIMQHNWQVFIDKWHLSESPQDLFMEPETTLTRHPISELMKMSWLPEYYIPLNTNDPSIDFA